MSAPSPLCSATDCERAVYARDHCERHYRQLLRTGALSVQRREERTCAVSACPRRAVTRGWCHAHYLRWVRTQQVSPDEALRPRDRPSCRIADCDAAHHGHGCCRAHLARVSRWGDPRSDVPLRCTSAGAG